MAQSQLAAATPTKQLAGFIAKFDPRIARLARSARAALRKQFFPTAVELVYDNYNALAIGWGPNERASECIISLAVFPRGANLYFMRDAKLRDPRKLLQGSGNHGRLTTLDAGPEHLSGVTQRGVSMTQRPNSERFSDGWNVFASYLPHRCRQRVHSV